MAYLLDTNVISRLVNSGDQLHATAQNAVESLIRRGESLYITPQNLIEFRVIATRPTDANGLGWSATDAETWIARFEARFGLLTENDQIFLR